MSSSSNGHYGGPHDPHRRLRFDLSTVIERTRDREHRRGGAGLGPTPAILPGADRGASGRRFVVIAAIAVAVVWGLLYLVFREWRARYLERATFGATQVAPAIDAFTDVLPPHVGGERWRDAVARTRAMLVTITASNLLSLDRMHALRDELDRAVVRVRANPEVAVAELAAVWDDMAERGEFLLRDTGSPLKDRHPRPAILPSYGDDRVAPALDPLADLDPPDVEPGRWRDAVARTRALVVDVTASRALTTVRMRDLRKDLDRAVARARDNPASAVDVLTDTWDSLTRSCRSLFAEPEAVVGRHPRPEIFPPR